MQNLESDGAILVEHEVTPAESDLPLDNPAAVDTNISITATLTLENIHTQLNESTTTQVTSRIESMKCIYFCMY